MIYNIPGYTNIMHQQIMAYDMKSKYINVHLNIIDLICQRNRIYCDRFVHNRTQRDYIIHICTGI
jgi:hypothetical protein